jgi:hypothetical protein
MTYITLRTLSIKSFFCYVMFYQNYEMLFCKAGLGKKRNDPDGLTFKHSNSFVAFFGSDVN